MTPHINDGMPREDVIVLLGQPGKQQVIGKTELLTYQPDWSLMNASAYNPIAIQDGKVVGRGLNRCRQDRTGSQATVTKRLPCRPTRRHEGEAIGS